MTPLVRLSLLIGLFFQTSLTSPMVTSPIALAAETFTPPPPPQYYVLDEPGILNPRNLQALQILLIEHDRVTSEQIVFGIFKDLHGQNVDQVTNQIFADWKVGKRGKDNGVLLALFWNDHQARIEVGYGLEQTLTDSKSRDILEDVLFPELRTGDPNRALSLAALEILRNLGSPLIESGQAQKILQEGGFHGPWKPSAPLHPAFKLVALLFGILVTLGLILIVYSSATASQEAHYNGSGWVHPSPWPRRGSGRFSGGFGGGRSGGGGASGSW